MEESLRVVQYIPDFGLGGVQKAGCVLGRELANLGFQCWVIGEQSGPRFGKNVSGLLTHRVIGKGTPSAIAERLLAFGASVIHIHASGYCDELVAAIYAKAPADFESGRRVLVSTPVFGRPPIRRETLSRTRTCCVGVYTFYRLCRWLNLSGSGGIGRGIAYVPLTPYEPPRSGVSANDPVAVVRSRRAALGIAGDKFVVGRIGRNDASKWHNETEEFINTLLNEDASINWLSVGLPIERGDFRLKERWGERFCNLPETADYELISQVLSSLDLQIFMSNHGECFASSIAEAAGMGVPTVALAKPLNDNGQAEQVIDDTTGLLAGSLASLVRDVLELTRDPSRLAKMKNSTAEYAIARWSSARVARDLIALYKLWGRSSGLGNLPEDLGDDSYVQIMLGEWADFNSSYRSRILDLMAAGKFERAKWKLLLSMVEFWPTFRLGRALKRLRNG